MLVCFVVFFSPETEAKLGTGVPLCFVLQVLFLYRQAKCIQSVVKKYFSVCILCRLMLLKVKEVAIF